MFENLIEVITEEDINSFYKKQKLKKGLYIRINKDNSIDSLIINEKTDELEHIEFINWIRERLRYSLIINEDTNKALNTKGFMRKANLSSNYLSLIFNYDTFCKKDNNKDIVSLLEVLVNEHYDIGVKENVVQKIFNIIPNQKGKNHTDEFKKIFHNEYSILMEDQDRDNVIETAKRLILNNLDLVYENINKDNIKRDDKIKINIFINEDISKYKLEHKLYLLANLSNNNDYNKIIENKLYIPIGIQNTFDSKKPFLKFYTNEKSMEYPNYIEIEQAIKALEVNSYILKNRNINTRYGEINIQNSKNDITSVDIKGFKARSDRNISIIDYFDNKKAIEPNVNYVWCSINEATDKALEAKDTKRLSSNQKTFVYMYKDIINKYVFEDISKPFIGNTDRIFNTLIHNLVKRDNEDIIKKIINLRIALDKKYKVNSFEGVELMFDNIKKIAIGEKHIDNRRQAMYLIGQLATYLLSNSSAKAENKFNQKARYINATSTEKLKNILTMDISKYSNNVIENEVFNNIIREIISFNFTNKKITSEDRDYIILGLLNNENVLFIKKEELRKEVM